MVETTAYFPTGIVTGKAFCAAFLDDKLAPSLSKTTTILSALITLLK